MTSEALSVNSLPEKSSMIGIMDEFKHFWGLKEAPFSLLPNTQYFVALPDYQHCLSLLSFATNCSEGIIKVTGEVGVGKTMVCRRFLNSIDETTFYTAYIPNPSLNPIELKRAVAKEIQVPDLNWIGEDELTEAINKRLIKLAQNNKKVILVIDEAQALPLETIETLRLLTNLETEKTKLIQIVLFAQPELDETLSKHEFRQIRQRITYSFQIKALSKAEVEKYVVQRLAYAGYQGSSCFDESSIQLLYRYSKGIPRIISIIATKAMLLAFSKGNDSVNAKMVKKAAMDTESVEKKLHFWSFCL